MNKASVGALLAALALLLAGCAEDAPPTGEADVEPGTPDRQEMQERIEDGPDERADGGA
jgi:PBP1b-binding outer membrane lipoprotein LpoB